MTTTPTPEAVENGMGLRTGNTALDVLTAERDALLARVDALTNCGICEVAAINPNVMEYMRHWEGRAEKAEVQVDALTKERDAMAENCDKLNHAYRQGAVAGHEKALTTARAEAAAASEAMREAAAKLHDTYANASFATERARGESLAWATEIRALPIPTDAAAALAEHDKRVREKERAEIVAMITEKQSGPFDDWERGKNDACEDIAAAILARGQKEGK